MPKKIDMSGVKKDYTFWVQPVYRKPCKRGECKAHEKKHSSSPAAVYPFWQPCDVSNGEHHCRLWEHDDAHQCSCGHKWARQQEKKTA